MPEYFDRYRDFERRETNKTIDEPVIFLWRCTFVELVVGFVSFVVGVYLFQVSGGLGCLGLILAVLLPFLMRWRRQNLPNNTFVHLAWFLGFMNSGLPKHLKRPEKYHLGP